MIIKNAFKFWLVLLPLFNLSKDIKAQYATDYSFESYKIKDGLSLGSTYTIYQDKLGYILVGNIGIERFDGYVFKNYRSNVLDSNALKPGNLYDINEDSKGNLWVVNGRFLSYLNRRTDKWKNFQNLKYPGSKFDLVVDEPNQQVFATSNGFGLLSYHYKTDTWEQFQLVKDTSSKKNLKNVFNKLVQLDANHLLISTNNGLLLFNTQSKKFEKEYLKSDDPLKEIVCLKFAKIDATHYYVGTSNGIYKFGLNEGVSLAFQNKSNDPNTIMGNKINGIYFDNLKKELWLGVAEMGIDIVHLNNNTITHLNVDTYPIKSIVKNSVNEIIKDKQENIWIATNDGVLKYDPTRKQIKVINDQEPIDLKLPFTNAWGALIDDKKHLWIGGNELNNGLVEVDLINKKLTKYLFEQTQTKTPLWKLFSDANNNIWAYRTEVKLNQGNDIFKKEKNESQFKKVANSKQFEGKPQQLNSFQTYLTENKNLITGGKPSFIMSDSNGKTIIKPFERLNKLADQFIHSFINKGNHITYVLTENNIYTWNESTNEIKLACPKLSFKEFENRGGGAANNIEVYKDSLALITIPQLGILEVDLKNQTKRAITINDGLSSQVLYDNYLDNKGQLWMSSDYGIIRYNILTKQFRTLTPYDGAQEYEYNSFCNFTTPNGDMIYAGQNGVNYFNISDVVDNASAPPVIIQKITKKNTVIPIESDNYEETIVVDYDENVLSIDFVAFNYKNTLQNKYKYKMEGYDNDWRESGTRHFTTYTNLPPGEYTFKVIASNNDGMWNEKGATVKIKILPAPWVSWWAYTIYLLLTGYLIYLFVQYKQKQQKKKLEDDRKNGELAEAKALQERLLPKTLPVIKNLDIAGYLRTSTEVGGDYYDFFEQPDGSLYAICGDATGHGTPSGMLVSITKAGIIGLPQMSPKDMLHELNRVVKKVDLGILRMSLNIALVKDNQITLSSAGMPPYFVYRASTNTTEEIQLSGVPLGSFNDVHFDQTSTSFNSGDILVIISDGLPEAPNLAGELFDYQKLQDLITTYGNKTAQEVIDQLMIEADAWLSGNHNPDDITLVVIKHK
jgi:ligand-binding sensor domain-containing protein